MPEPGTGNLEIRPSSTASRDGRVSRLRVGSSHADPARFTLARGTGMKPIVTFAALLLSLAFTAWPRADGPDRPAVDPVQSAFDKLVRAATNTDWPSELAARQELASLAQKAVPKVTEAAHSHGEAPCPTRLLRAAYDHVREG